jgi:outer membrane receptor protein involved in Fe transport
MMSKLLHASGALVAALVLVLTDPASAALTGKLAGRVTDASTGEPIPGAAVVLVGARIGATTDADGYYFVLNVSPGEYAVQASLVGYRSETRREVRVNVDRTTPVGFELSPTAIEVEGVTVTAPREVVQLDVSGSKAILQGSELRAVPVRNLEEALALQPAVQPRGQIRGGSLDQTQVIVDGHLLTDVRYNFPVLNINSTIIEEIQVLSGGFSAEFGNARSGIVNVVSRGAAGQPI